MNKLVKIFVILTIFTLLVMPALGAYVYDPKNDHSVLTNYKYAAPVAKLKVQISNAGGRSPVDVTAYDVTDENRGKKVVWKKWYVDNQLVSTDPNVKKVKKTFVNNDRNVWDLDTHKIKLIVANPANAKNPSKTSWNIYVHPPNPWETVGEVNYGFLVNPEKMY